MSREPGTSFITSRSEVVSTVLSTPTNQENRSPSIRPLHHYHHHHLTSLLCTRSPERKSTDRLSRPSVSASGVLSEIPCGFRSSNSAHRVLILLWSCPEMVITYHFNGRFVSSVISATRSLIHSLPSFHSSYFYLSSSFSFVSSLISNSLSLLFSFKLFSNFLLGI